MQPKSGFTLKDHQIQHVSEEDH